MATTDNTVRELTREEILAILEAARGAALACRHRPCSALTDTASWKIQGSWPIFSSSPISSHRTTRCLATERDALRGKVRDLTKRYQAGGRDAFEAYRDLVSPGARTVIPRRRGAAVGVPLRLPPLSAGPAPGRSHPSEREPQGACAPARRALRACPLSDDARLARSCHPASGRGLSGTLSDASRRLAPGARGERDRLSCRRSPAVAPGATPRTAWSPETRNAGSV